MYKYMYHVQFWCLWKSEEGGCWELNSAPYKEQYMFLIVEPSLQCPHVGSYLLLNNISLIYSFACSEAHGIFHLCIVAK